MNFFPLKSQGYPCFSRKKRQFIMWPVLANKEADSTLTGKDTQRANVTT